jgi:hypothetical protein
VLELADGARLTWSVADGRRGRRWRAVSTIGGTITHTVLLEVDPAGRPSRLELTTPVGLLTLHPSADQREIHGNVVTSTGEGVRPLGFAWGAEHDLEVVGRPLATAVGLWRRSAILPVGDVTDVDVLAIGPALDVVPGQRRFERLSETRWRVTPSGAGGGSGPSFELEIDADGLPVAGIRWPLEVA